MPTGPGKYDSICTLVRETSHARAAIVIIIGGNQGTGYSLQTEMELSAIAMATILEEIATEIRNIEKGQDD